MRWQARALHGIVRDTRRERRSAGGYDPLARARIPCHTRRKS